MKEDQEGDDRETDCNCWARDSEKHLLGWERERENEEGRMRRGQGGFLKRAARSPERDGGGACRKRCDRGGKGRGGDGEEEEDGRDEKKREKERMKRGD